MQRGRIVAAAQEERFSRIKHPHPYLPAQFQAWVFIKSDALDIGYRETGVIQAISKGGCRECLVVLRS
jgi:predicted NodU family carbamoyl transferase